MTDERMARLERSVRWLTLAIAGLSVAVVFLAGVLVVISLPAPIRLTVWTWAGAAVPVVGVLFVGVVITVLMIHREIPAIAREVGRWFAPVE
jgi:hypothetical protein